MFYADRVGPAGQVLAFEPNFAAFECLHHNVQWMPVTCHHAGLSDATSTAAIATDINAGASHLTDGKGCALLALDSLNLQRLDFFKLDVEGFEVRALRGAKDTIHRCRPVMLIEVNESALSRQGVDAYDIFAELDGLGYTWRNVYKGHKMEGPQYDIICFP